MRPLENRPHEAFAQALFERSGLTRGQAYSAAGYTKNPDAAKVNASRLLKSAKHIVDRVQELHAKPPGTSASRWSSIVDELEGARQIA
jgi:hypothetical protein